MTELVVGGIGILIAALLGGATGFGFGLVAAPSLLATGIPLHQVVAINLTLALLTRLLSAWQLRRHLVWSRAGRLVAGSIPGILAGFAVRSAIDTDMLKIFAGVVAIGAVLILTLRTERAGRTESSTEPRAEPRAEHGTTKPSAALVAGAGGGFLGVTTSLNGVPPALLLTRDRVEQLSFVADLTIYFVVSNILTLTLLTASDPDTLGPLGRYVLVWLPLGLLGNQVGVRLARVLPYRVFRGISLTVVFVAGCVTVAGAL